MPEGVKMIQLTEKLLLKIAKKDSEKKRKITLMEAECGRTGQP